MAREVPLELLKDLAHLDVQAKKRGREVFPHVSLGGSDCGSELRAAIRRGAIRDVIYNAGVKVRSHRKRIVTAVGVALILGFSVLVWRAYHFDSDRWKAAGDGSATRFRMKDDLVRRINDEKWTFGQTISELGPPSGGGRRVEAPGSVTYYELQGTLEYYLGDEPLPALFGGPWSLNINFDQSGRVVHAYAAGH